MSLPCFRYYSQYLPDKISFNLQSNFVHHNQPMRRVLLSSPFNRLGNWSTGWFNWLSWVHIQGKYWSHIFTPVQLLEATDLNFMSIDKFFSIPDLGNLMFSPRYLYSLCHSITLGLKNPLLPNYSVSHSNLTCCGWSFLLSLK